MLILEMIESLYTSKHHTNQVRQNSVIVSIRKLTRDKVDI